LPAARCCADFIDFVAGAPEFFAGLILAGGVGGFCCGDYFKPRRFGILRALATRVKRSVCILFMLIAWLTGLHRATAANVTLSWNASPDADATGYAVHYGTVSGSYPHKVVVGLTTNVTISNLCAGVTYYFAATTLYAASGQESTFSSEVSHTPAGVLTLSRRAASGGAAQINFPVEPGHWYEVQATTNFQTWTTIRQTGIATSNAWSQISDPDAGSFKARYYRLVLH
jgi:hypothetical protein